MKGMRREVDELILIIKRENGLGTLVKLRYPPGQYDALCIQPMENSCTRDFETLNILTFFINVTVNIYSMLFCKKKLNCSDCDCFSLTLLFTLTSCV